MLYPLSYRGVAASHQHAALRTIPVGSLSGPLTFGRPPRGSSADADTSGGGRDSPQR